MLPPFWHLVSPATTAARRLPLPPTLRSLYGELAFPSACGRPYVISNFVSTLDGVVSLGIPGKSGGGEIRGFNQHDRALMGLWRAAAGPWLGLANCASVLLLDLDQGQSLSQGICSS
jgi:hypothetical protein